MYDVMSCMRCLMTCVPVVFFIVVLHLSGWVSCSCLLCFGVIWEFHPSLFVAIVGVGGVSAAHDYYCGYCDGVFDDFVELDHFCTIPCSWNLPPT